MKKFLQRQKKPHLNETDRGKEFQESIFQNFSNDINIEPYSRKKFLAAVFAGRFNRTKRDLRKKPVFLKRDGNWIDVLPTITKQYNNRG